MPVYSDEVLEQTPERVTRFLAATGAVPAIRTLLAQAGMMDDDILEGRNLLLAILAAPRSPEAVRDTDQAKAQREAVAELDQWDEPNFARFQAALRRRFPPQEEYVFHELAASTGPTAVQGVATFLARIEALDKGSDPAREASRKQDKKAVELLTERGLDKKERARLQQLVDVALGPTDALPDTPEPIADANRREKLVRLKSWYDEWAPTAKAVIKKRVYLIRMGLATRKPPTRKAKAPQEPPK